MGLAGEKRRGKLSHDPNNTTWSKSTDNFGHRMLSQRGWKPGDYLGAENASHGEHYTAANASHIKVFLREDNLGLGAKLGGAANAETFGLSTLSGIFGRLNGKTDIEVEKQQSNLRDAELRTYQTQKYGHMNFVRGGLLVGDKIKELPGKKLAAKTVDSQSAGKGNDSKDKVKKKRKAELSVLEDGEGQQQVMKKKKKQKSDLTEAVPVSVGTEEPASLVHASASDVELQVRATAEEDTNESAKRTRKERRKDQDGESLVVLDDVRAEKARLRLEKRARKEERRRRKEQKKHGQNVETVDPASDAESAVAVEVATPLASELPSGVSTPASMVFAGSRHAVRQRYIMQKRAASMDPKALNEILMIKAQV
ncbi:hypothetical protein LTR62_006605 [Meristemomyces frigidus]|uniref:G-patch domain-containing protein n=1 Tax=Meristemomyces frigidus TaxID=1508187 RepID=A0AAN7TCN4_9PEZI|nr:hypothetical protein LTR62_006605 [Meristemomyces frigidus]